VCVAIVNFIYYAFNDLKFGAKFPLHDYLFQPNARMSDFFRNYDMWRGPNASEAVQYRIQQTTLDPLPVWNLAHFPFTLIPNRTLAAFMYFAAVGSSVSVGTWLSFKGQPRELRVKLTLAIVLFSYVSHFTLERGNIEVAAFLFVVISVRTFESNTKLSAVFLLFSCAVKPWVGLLFLLYIKRKKWLALFISIIVYLVTVITTPIIIRVAHGMPLKNLFSLNPQANGFSYYGDAYILNHVGLGYGNSLYGGIKALLLMLGTQKPDSLLIFPYTVAICITTLILIIWALNKNVPDGIARSMLLGVAILFPYVSADYKLLYMILALGLIIENSAFINFKSAKFLVVLGALVISGKSFVRIDHRFLDQVPVPVLSSVVLSPLLLVCFLVILGKSQSRSLNFNLKSLRFTNR